MHVDAVPVDVPELPAGAESAVSDWRCQAVDGSILVSGDLAPCVYFHGETYSIAQAWDLGAALIAAADLANDWAGGAS